MREISNYFNEKIRGCIQSLCHKNSITEIRMRIGKPLIINFINNEVVLEHVIVTEGDIKDTFNIATEYSAYAYEDNIKNGFLSGPGGHRIGFGGVAVTDNGSITGLKNIMFLNIRVCHQIENCSFDVYKKIHLNERLRHTLIISPPGLGKTTLLRDLIKNISNNKRGTSICVIDERNEIAGTFRGIPTIDLGKRTDIISNCNKKDGILMAVRAMGPQVIAVDEIGGTEDMTALRYASVSGVVVIATLHGESVEDAKNKMGQDLLTFFKNIVVIKEKGEYICY